MRKTLAFASFILLSAGQSFAQTPEELFFASVIQTLGCTPRVLLGEELNAYHQKLRDLPDDGKGKGKAMDALDTETKQTWLKEQLTGRVTVEETGAHERSIRAELYEERAYEFVKLNLFELYELEVSMSQALRGDTWVPQNIKLHLHYRYRRKEWLGTIWTPKIHERYEIAFDCPESAAATQ